MQNSCEFIYVVPQRGVRMNPSNPPPYTLAYTGVKNVLFVQHWAIHVRVKTHGKQTTRRRQTDRQTDRHAPVHNCAYVCLCKRSTSSGWLERSVSSSGWPTYCVKSRRKTRGTSSRLTSLLLSTRKSSTSEPRCSYDILFIYLFIYLFIHSFIVRKVGWSWFNTRDNSGQWNSCHRRFNNYLTLRLLNATLKHFSERFISNLGFKNMYTSLGFYLCF